jgi:hypothetical protein
LFAQQVRLFIEHGTHPAVEGIAGIWLVALVLVIPSHADNHGSTEIHEVSNGNRAHDEQDHQPSGLRPERGKPGEPFPTAPGIPLQGFPRTPS